MATPGGNPNNPNDLKTVLQGLADSIKQMADNQEQTKKARAEREKQAELKKNTSKLEALGAKIGNLGDSLNSLLEPIKDYQSGIRSLAIAFEDELATVMQGSLPLQTRMNAELALLRSGLGSNEKVLGKFIARAAALGENISSLANSFRDIRQSLGLNTGQLDNLGTYIMDSARTYKVSSDNLAQAMASLGKQIGVLGFTGAGESAKAIADAVARTQMGAPGGIQSILGPMLSGGIDSLVQSQMSGMQRLLIGLTRNQVTSSDEIFSSIQEFVDRIDSRLGSAAQQSPQLANTILQQLYGISFEQYNTMKTVLEESRKSPTQLERIAASVEEVENSITQLLPAIKEPFVQIAGFLASLTQLAPIFYKSVVGALTVGGIFLVLSKGIVGIINNIKLLIAAVAPKPDALPIGKTAIFGAAFPLVGLLVGFLTPLFMELIGSSEETAEQVTEINEREKNKGLDRYSLDREARLMAVNSLGTILAASQRSGFMRDYQTEDQTRLQEALLHELRTQSNYLESIYKKPIPRPAAQTPLVGG